MGYWSADGKVWNPDAPRVVLSDGTILDYGAAADGQTLVRRGPLVQGEGPIAASATRASTQTITSGSVQIIDLDTSEYALGPSGLAPTVDLTNNRIVVNLTGLYRISVCWTISPSANPANTQIASVIRVNAVDRTITGFPLTTAGCTSLAVLTAQLTATDYVDFRVSQSSGANASTITATELRPRLQVELVR